MIEPPPPLACNELVGEVYNITKFSETHCGAACPFAVRQSPSSCFAKCVPTFNDCLAESPFVPRLREANVCDSNPRRLCISYDKKTGLLCEECHDGFYTYEGECEAKGAQGLEIVGVVMLLVVVGFAFYIGWKVVKKFKYLGCGTEEAKHRYTINTPLLRTTTSAEQEAERHRLNQVAIAHGRDLSALSSIAAHINGICYYWQEDLRNQLHSMFQQNHKGLNLIRWLFMRTDSVKVGIGLLLFYHVQVFLIYCSTLFYLAMWYVEHQTKVAGIITTIQQHNSDYLHCDPQYFAQMFDKIEEYANTMSIVCVLLWLVIVISSWLFMYFAMLIAEDYDKDHATFEDYSIELKGLPPDCFEDKLEQVLLKELQLKSTELHGVLVMRDVRSHVEQIKHMSDRLIEADDIESKWCDATICREDVNERLVSDREELQKIWTSLKSSGHAFAVFPTQERANVIAHTRKGFFYDADHYVRIEATSAEPHGVVWEHYGLSKCRRESRMLLLYVSAAILYACFVWVCYIVKVMFMNRYLNIGVKPDQSDIVLQTFVNFVGGVNALTQMAVQESSSAAGHHRQASRDRFILRFDCVCVGLNILSMVFFIAYCGEMKTLFDRSNTDFPHNLHLEASFGANLYELLVTNILFVQFIANLVLSEWFPPVFFRFVLYICYVWEPAEFLSAWLKSILPVQPRRTDRITGREAEQILAKPPLLISLKYTFALVYPAAGFLALFLFTDQADSIAVSLLYFSIFFFLVQRFLSIWWLRVSASDTVATFYGFMNAWGGVLGMIPSAGFWWQWRRQRIQSVVVDNMPMSWFITVPIIYLTAVQFYLHVLWWIRWNTENKLKTTDGGVDLGVKQVIEQRKGSWWNMNPIYVLGVRHELITRDWSFAWPDGCQVATLLESGRFFRLDPPEKYADIKGKKWYQKLVT